MFDPINISLINSLIDNAPRAKTMQVHEVIHGMLSLYAKAEGTPDPEEALYTVIGDPDEAGVSEAEWHRRSTLISRVFAACACDLAALGDVVRDKRPIVAVLRAGLDGQAAGR